MTTGYVILNRQAGGADSTRKLEAAIEGTDGFEILFPEEPGEAGALSAERANDVDVIIVAGGDGTLHEVVNGVWKASGGKASAAVGIIPLGTGNDLARTLAIPDDPIAAFNLACRGQRRAIDLIHLEYGSEQRVAANVCAGGFSGVLNERLTPEFKRTWGPLAYLMGAAATIPDVSNYETRLAFDGEPEEAVDAFNIVVANGRTAGGGVPAAPRANPEDGLLEVVIIRQGTAGELGSLATLMLRGEYLDHDLVIHRRAKTLHVRSEPGIWFNADGELITNEPIAFTVIPGGMRFVVGPQYNPVVETDE